MDFVLSGLDVSGARRYEGRFDSDETKRRLNVDSMKSMWDTNHMNYELHKTVKSHYQIEYMNIWEPNVWYPSKSVKETFTSFVEACRKARELTKAQQESPEPIISEYRVVEHVVTTNTEVLKSFPVGSV